MSRKTGKGSQSGAGITPASLASRFDLGLREHQRGKLDRARRLYEMILKPFPHHADVLHMLGLLEHQSGNQAASIELFNRTIQAGASGAELYTNLGTALQASGNNSDAIAAYRKAVALSIEAEEGNSYSLRRSGRYAQSQGYIRRLAKNVGLGEISVDACVLRMDKRQPIHGNIVLLQRPE